MSRFLENNGLKQRTAVIWQKHHQTSIYLRPKNIYIKEKNNTLLLLWEQFKGIRNKTVYARMEFYKIFISIMLKRFFHTDQRDDL